MRIEVMRRLATEIFCINKLGKQNNIAVWSHGVPRRSRHLSFAEMCFGKRNLRLRNRTRCLRKRSAKKQEEQELNVSVWSHETKQKNQHCRLESWDVSPRSTFQFCGAISPQKSPTYPQKSPMSPQKSHKRKRKNKNETLRFGFMK